MAVQSLIEAGQALLNERKSCPSYAAVYELPTVACPQSRLPAAANVAVAVPCTLATFKTVTVARGGRVQAR